MTNKTPEKHISRELVTPQYCNTCQTTHNFCERCWIGIGGNHKETKTVTWNKKQVCQTCQEVLSRGGSFKDLPVPLDNP